MYKFNTKFLDSVNMIYKTNIMRKRYIFFTFNVCSCDFGKFENTSYQRGSRLKFMKIIITISVQKVSIIVCYFQNEAILNHYMKLADESPIPIVVYNMPFVTGIDIPISVLAKLAHHPNIRGVKDGDVSRY